MFRSSFSHASFLLEKNGKPIGWEWKTNRLRMKNHLAENEISFDAERLTTFSHERKLKDRYLIFQFTIYYMIVVYHISWKMKDFFATPFGKSAWEIPLIFLSKLAFIIQFLNNIILFYGCLFSYLCIKNFKTILI